MKAAKKVMPTERREPTDRPPREDGAGLGGTGTTEVPCLVGIEGPMTEIQSQLRVSESKADKDKDRKGTRDKEKERVDALRQKLAQRESKLEKLEQAIHQLEVDQHLLCDRSCACLGECLEAHTE